MTTFTTFAPDCKLTVTLHGAPQLNDRFLAQLWALRNGAINLSDEVAITLFAAYNKLRDVRTAELYKRLEPWGA